jgi:hypothetical protein
LVADGLFTRHGRFHVMPEIVLKPLEELFRARVTCPQCYSVAGGSRFLWTRGLLPPARANMLRGWVHSGFNVHRSRQVLPDEREDPPSRFACYGGTSLERLAQYIIRNPFAVEKMQHSAPSLANPEGAIIYRSGLNPKIQRNFVVFTPCDFIAAITQHIPDKSKIPVRRCRGASSLSGTIP